jgi:hypothetical protein
MRLLHPEELPNPPQGTVCRQSRLATLLGSVAILAMIIGILAYLLWKAHAWWRADLIAGMLALLLLKWIAGNAWRSLQSTNWLLRIGPDCLLINIRSYANCDFAPARTVVELPVNDIKSVGDHIQNRIDHNADRNVRVTERFLDMRCSQPVAAESRAEIAEERRRYARGTAIGGLVTYSSRAGHHSVTVPEDDLIRIAWRNQCDWIIPSLSRTLRALQGRVSIADAVHTDNGDPEKCSADQLDQLILRLAESDDRLATIKLLKSQRGYSTNAAKEFVDDVVGSL